MKAIAATAALMAFGSLATGCGGESSKPPAPDSISAIPETTTAGAEVAVEVTPKTLQFTGTTCSGALDLVVSDLWSYDPADAARESLYCRFDPTGTELPVAFVSAECSYQKPGASAKAAEFAWGDLDSYNEYADEYAKRELGATEPSQKITLAGLPAIATTSGRGGAAGYIAHAFTRGPDSVLVKLFFVVFDAADSEGLRSEFNQMVASVRHMKFEKA